MKAMKMLSPAPLKVPQLDTQSLPKYMSPFSCQELREICKGFMKKNHLEAIEFARYYNDGTGFMLHSDPSMISYNVKEGIPFTAPAPENLISEKFWYFLSKEGRYDQIFQDFKDQFKVGAILNRVERFIGYYEVLSFGFSIDNVSAANFFINHKEELDSFANLFRDKAAHLIREAEKEKIQIPPHQLPNFKGFEEKKRAIDTGVIGRRLGNVQRRLRNLICEFDQIIVGHLPQNLVISRKELSCVKFLLLGYTSKEMADEMELSVRTVEAYMESIKRKLGCDKKSEIVTKFLENELP